MFNHSQTLFLPDADEKQKGPSQLPGEMTIINRLVLYSGDVNGFIGISSSKRKTKIHEFHFPKIINFALMNSGKMKIVQISPFFLDTSVQNTSNYTHSTQTHMLSHSQTHRFTCIHITNSIRWCSFL